MSLSPRARILHAEYNESTPAIQWAVDRAYDFVRKSFEDSGFVAAGDDYAEELVAHIYNYLMDSNKEAE